MQEGGFVMRRRDCVIWLVLIGAYFSSRTEDTPGKILRSSASADEVLYTGDRAASSTIPFAN